MVFVGTLPCRFKRAERHCGAGREQRHAFDRQGLSLLEPQGDGGASSVSSQEIRGYAAALRPAWPATRFHGGGIDQPVGRREEANQNEESRRSITMSRCRPSTAHGRSPTASHLYSRRMFGNIGNKSHYPIDVSVYIMQRHSVNA